MTELDKPQKDDIIKGMVNERPFQFYLPKALFMAAKLKAISEERSLAQVLRELLWQWVGWEGRPPA